MKQIRIFAMLAALCMILPLACQGPYAPESRHSNRGEITVVNDTDTQVSFRITTEKYGRLRWTYKPGYQNYLNNGPDKIRMRVSGDDEIEIADWGKSYIRDVAEYRDGAWYLSIRHARSELRHR